MKLKGVAFFIILISLFTFIVIGNANAVSGSVYAYSFPEIEFCYKDKVYKWNLSANGDASYIGTYQKQMKLLNNKKIGLKEIAKQMKQKNYTDIQILNELLPDFEKLFAEIKSGVESEFIDNKINFNPQRNGQEMFSFSKGQVGVKIDESKLLKDILNGKHKIEIKVAEQKPRFAINDLKEATTLRSSESTSFAGSEEGRKYNLKKAMATFNGLIVMPNEVVSFSKVLNKNDDGEPYKEAIVIVDGVFTKGIGGGICQASTTIYNAVLMAGLEIVEVHRHTLPVGYVEKGFDAMVNDAGVDMKFKNNTQFPVYIKTFARDNKVFAQVYGQDLNGISYKKVSEYIRDIEPGEPKIIPDTEGKYISRIKYKGEFYTEKYAKKGYEVKGYIYTYKNDKLEKIKLVRHEKYASSRAIIYEGIENPPLSKQIIDSGESCSL